MISPQSFQIDMRIYPGHVLVCVNESPEEIRRILKKAKVDLKTINDVIEYPREVPASAVMFDSGNMGMFFRDVSQGIDFADYVAHEIFHIVSMKFRHIGMELNSGSEEAYAYMIGYMTKKFYENLKP
jgi:hypothetical protein